jgi:peptide/nickel transport system substrate-binding protein
MFDSRLSGSALDYAAFHTPALDSAFVRVSAATTKPQLADAWRAVQQILDAETPAAWVYHSRGVQGVTSRLLGVRMDLRGEMPTVAQWRLSGAAAIQ